MEYDYIFFLAVILFSTKLLGLLTKKIKLPQVVGALCARTYTWSGLFWNR